MTILYIIIVLLAIIILLLLLLIYKFSKNYFNNYDKKLILFVIDMYLLYGESIDIFPKNESKKILLDRINKLKNKIESDANNKEGINKK